MVTTVTPDQLKDFATECFAKVGVPQDEAVLVSTTLVEADARGIHSHGVMRLPIYVKRLRKGLVRPVAEVTLERETETTALLDGNYSIGQVVATRAMNLAIEKARRQGLGAVVIKSSGHFGIAARYALLACQRNMIGIAMSNTTPIMPAVGGAEKTIGNNPLAIAVPSNNQYPFVLDMALSSVALGKVLFAHAKGNSIPDDWGVDKNGVPTTDPSEVLEGGFVTPMAGPKGFGLALVIEALTSVLAGGPFAKMVPSMYDLTRQQALSHFMLVIDVSHFIPVDLFKERMSLLSTQVKESEKTKGVEQIFLPGEIEWSLQAEQIKARSIPIEENTFRELKELASSLQVSFPESR